MSLQVWLPLINDIKNQGISGVESSWIGSSTIDYVDGKLGKVVKFGDGTSSKQANGVSINSNLVEELGDEYSCSVWVKPMGNHLHYEGAIISSGNWNNDAWAFGVNQDNTKVDLFGPSYNRNIDCNIPVNEWTHLVSTVRNGIGTLYKNGIVVGTYDFSRIYPDGLKSDYANTTIGRETYADGYFSFNGCLQDLRVYNHALSPLEIKKLSQGLVAHWPLSIPGNENLLIESYRNISLWDKIDTGTWNLQFNNEVNTITLVKTGNWEHLYKQILNLTIGETYTLSCNYQVPQTYNRWSANYSVGLSLNAAEISNSQLRTDIIIPFGSNQTDGIQHGSVTFTATQETYYLDINGGYIADGSTNITFIISNIKLEKGDKATPWIPNPADSDYSKIGFDDNIEYDVSGYQHNGTKSGVTYSTDTPRYNTSTYFDGLDDMILIQNLDLSNVLNNQCTISFWIKPDGESGYRSIYFSAYSGVSWSLEKNAGNALRSYWNANPDKTVATAIADNVWCHIVVVKNGSDSVKVYKDGILKGEITATHSNLNFATTWRIGRDTRSNDGTPYCGLMSDFRIYATAFSDDDVLSLYNTPISLSSNATLLTQGEYSEV